jgi:hypothetical protein
MLIQRFFKKVSQGFGQTLQTLVGPGRGPKA